LHALATGCCTAINRFVVSARDGHMGTEYCHGKVLASIIKKLGAEVQGQRGRHS